MKKLTVFAIIIHSLGWIWSVLLSIALVQSPFPKWFYWIFIPNAGLSKTISWLMWTYILAFLIYVGIREYRAKKQGRDL